jgi:VanZ family protein
MTLRAWRGLFVLAVVVQCLALYWPRTPSIDTGLPVDKVVHVALFGVVALLGMLAHLPLGWLAGGLVAQAAVSELVQNLLPARGSDVKDFLADLLGVRLGLGAGVLLRRRSSSGRTSAADASGAA